MRTSETHPIRVDWAPAPAPPRRIGMTLAPGKKYVSPWSGPWQRDLDADLRRLREECRTDVLVSLIDDHELLDVQIPELGAKAAEFGMEIRRFPITDMSVPRSMDETQELVTGILRDLSVDRTVVIHCMGGLGRTGLVAACVLIALGASSADAIRGIRHARPGAIQTIGQERFVSAFGERR